MKSNILILLFPLFCSNILAQSTTEFEVTLEEFSIDDAPQLQSFVSGSYEGKWVLIGGRTDGLHRRQPWAAFQPEGNNLIAYVIDPLTSEVYSSSLSSLPDTIYEQLQSTNMEFEQHNEMLYIIGGYGYSGSKSDHITYPKLCAVDLSGLVPAIINGNNISSHFRQITDERLMVTGGYLDRLHDKYYLAGGQSFEGRYNPMGPSHGPGFVQEYTNAIRIFKIQDDGNTLGIANYTEWLDEDHLHRRDYNMVPQIFSNGSDGFTMFSGVFKHDQDLPWLNSVDIVPTGYTVRSDFNQYLNQYHSAHVPIYDSTDNAMHTVFFGGIGRYTLDENNQLIDDPDVPFVKTISQVTRYADDSMEEISIGEMDGFIGSSAEFLAKESTGFFDEQGILILDALPYSKTLIGYIYGGIESTAENIFWTNNGTQSSASNRIFKVFITKGSTNSIQQMNGDRYFDATLYPNPSDTDLSITFQTPEVTKVEVGLYNLDGAFIKSVYQKSTNGDIIQLNTQTLQNGAYIIRISNDQFQKEMKFTVVHL